MTREEAERICTALGWVVLNLWPYDVEVMIDGGRQTMLFHETLEKLDPDRPPTLAQLRRLHGGIQELYGSDPVQVGDLLDGDDPERRLGVIWELGANK